MQLWLIVNVLMRLVLWHCWLGGRKGIQPVKTKWWGVGVVICLERDADLHTAQLMPLPLTVSCFRKSRLVLPFWYRLTWVVPDKGPLNRCVRPNAASTRFITELQSTKTNALSISSMLHKTFVYCLFNLFFFYSQRKDPHHPYLEANCDFYGTEK